MRHFAAELQARDIHVHYVRLDARDNSGTLGGEVERCLGQFVFDEIIITEPGEYRLLQELKSWEQKFQLPVRILEDRRFIASHSVFEEWAKGRKVLVMKYWYRLMRRQTGLLMTDGKPQGDKWNFDKQNRKPLKQSQDLKGPKRFKPDAVSLEVLGLVEREFTDHFGVLEPFWFAVTARQAGQALEHFIEYQLPAFGDYQDAMLAGEAFVYHSILSQYLNCGLLDPLAVCKRVEEAWQAGLAPLNAAEGFIRQIIGWREYIRGIYWLQMPGYADRSPGI